MNKILSILFIGFGLGESAFAFSPEFHIGSELDLSRTVIKPAFFPILNAGLNASSEDYFLDLDFKFSVEHPKANALSSKNFYYQIISEPSDFQVSIGRKKILWSELDENWGLGQYNPLDAWDRLRSFSQGLTGIFLSSKYDLFKFNLFASYLMLPEINPNVVIENNNFSFYHPQAVSAGPQTFELLNKVTPLGYNLILPKLGSILLRPSFTLSIETEEKSAPFFAKISYGYLPLNYFPIALQASLLTPINTIVVNLYPRLLSHHLYNLEISYLINEEVKTGFSTLVDQIVSESSIPSDYTTAPLGTTTYLSPWLKFNIFKLTHLYSIGGISQDIGPDKNPSHNIFSSRILYRNATQVQVELAEVTAKVLHEFSINANWVSVDWKHSWSKNLSSVLGGDIISSEKDAALDGGAEFLSDLRALDRIRIGVNYVF